MYIHVCNVFRDVNTVLSNLVHVVRIPDGSGTSCQSATHPSLGPTLLAFKLNALTTWFFSRPLRLEDRGPLRVRVSLQPELGPTLEDVFDALARLQRPLLCVEALGQDVCESLAMCCPSWDTD